MPIVWTVEARDALLPKTRAALPPSKQLSQEKASAKLAKAIAVPDWKPLPVRALFVAASDDARASCVTAFEKAWASGSLAQRTGMALVTSRADWGNEVARAWLEEKVLWPELIYPIVTDLELAKKVVAKRSSSRAYYELVSTFGDALFPLLEEIFANPRDEFDLWHCARSMALYDDRRAAEKLATVLRKAKIRPYASDFFVRFPHHAEAVLGPMAKGKTKVARLAAELLESARRKATAAPASEEASPEELPPILVTPPWTAKKRPTIPALTIDRPMPPRKERMSLDADVTNAAVSDAELVQKTATPMPDDPRKEYERATTSGSSNFDLLVYHGHRVPEELQLAAWDAGAKIYSYSTDVIDYMLGKFGKRALEGLVKYVAGAFSYASEARGEALMGVDSARIAVSVAKYTHKRERKSLAWRWLRRYGETAAFALAPSVLDGDEDADFVMRALVREGVDVAGASAPWGNDVAAAMTRWIEFDRRGVLPKKLPKMPPSWKPDTYTRPLLKNGKPLPLAAVDAIGMMLAISQPEDPYAGLEDVKAACEPRSLAELAWDIARSWEHGGAKSQHGWMRDALIWFADDEVVRRTTPAMKAENVIDTLAVLGTSAAQMELVTIAAKGYAQAEQALRHIAESQRITQGELEDRIVPTAGLDARGELVLDYGARKLTVGFDSRLEPYVVGEDGGKLKALPPVRKTDDPDKAEIAKRIWADLKEDVGALAVRRIRVLERAMCSGRTWSADDFKTLFVLHPLTSHLARGLVWAALPDTLFRIAEDGTLADENDTPVDLGDGIVQIAHPIRNGAEALARWQQTFTDYELVQPFTQILRATRGLKPEQTEAAELDVEVPPIERDELASRLREYAAERANNRFVRPMYAMNGSVSVHVGPGRIDRVKVSFTRKRVTYDLRAVPAIDISEALYDVLG